MPENYSKDLDILIVEDDSLQAKKLKKELINSGYNKSKINLKSSVKDAKTFIVNYPVDLLIFDIVLDEDNDSPESRGIKLVEWIDSHFNIAYICITGNRQHFTNTIVKTKLRKEFFIKKPYIFSELTEVIASVLRDRRYVKGFHEMTVSKSWGGTKTRKDLLIDIAFVEIREGTITVHTIAKKDLKLKLSPERFLSNLEQSFQSQNRNLIGREGRFPFIHIAKEKRIINLLHVNLTYSGNGVIQLKHPKIDKPMILKDIDNGTLFNKVLDKLEHIEVWKRSKKI